MKDIRAYIEKYCYISCTIITAIIFFIMYLILNNNNLSITFVDQFSSTIVQIAGGLIGFLLTALTIFLSLPKDTKVMKRVKNYGHHLIFSKCIFFGIFYLVMCILFWCFNVNEVIIFILFIFGLEETIISAYYIYKLCIYNFE